MKRVLCFLIILAFFSCTQAPVLIKEDVKIQKKTAIKKEYKEQSSLKKPVLLEEISGPANELRPYVHQQDFFFDFRHPKRIHGTKILFFSSDRPGGFGGFDIYYSLFENGKWSPPQNMGPKINTKFNELNPCSAIHPETKKKGHWDDDYENILYFYFASDRPESFGGKDIWFSRLLDMEQFGPDAPWSQPANLGKNINSAADEDFPSVCSYGSHLFFSTDRNAGSFKIFGSYFENGSFGESKIFSGPINSTSEESAPFINFYENELFLVSNRDNGYGDSDIYMVSTIDKNDTIPERKEMSVTNLGTLINTTNLNYGCSLDRNETEIFFSSHRGKSFDIYYYNYKWNK